MKSKSDDILWLRLKTGDWNMKRDIKIGGVYNSQANSTYSRKGANEMWETLEKESEGYAVRHHIIIMGDFNARTGKETDRIDLDDTVCTPVPENYTYDEDKPPKQNSDKGRVCANGRKLLQFCKTSGSIILNSRTLGDTFGSRTSFQYNGSSTVDYAIVSRKIWADILYFQVHDIIEDIRSLPHISFLELLCQQS